jgi:hypothetical protein
MVKPTKKTKRVETTEVQGYEFGHPVDGRVHQRWQETVGTYIAGEEEITEADLVASEMDRKWGADRLRLLVPVELREKFDRQRYKFNQAIWHGSLEEVRQEARRMIAAWRALDRVAAEAGRAQAAPEVWEVALTDGRTVALLRDWQDAALFAAQRDGRAAEVYTLAEIARLIEAFPEVVKAKQTFPGASVTAAKGVERDPLNGVPDSRAPIDDVIPF